MELIFDCGSTKCTIVQRSQSGNYLRDITIDGFNPIFSNDIPHATYEHFNDSLNKQFSGVKLISFCGAGCIDDITNNGVKIGLEKIFPYCEVQIYSDLEFLGKILDIKEKSIIGILGTGSNAGLWDGNQISVNTISGGYLLGDEGSAFVLGKKLLINYLRGNFTDHTNEYLNKIINLNTRELIQKLYSSELPNKEIASYASLYNELENDPLKGELITECFEEYIQKRIMPLMNDVSTIHLFGSVAYFNQQYLKPLLEKVNLYIGKISRGPLDLIIQK